MADVAEGLYDEVVGDGVDAHGSILSLQTPWTVLTVIPAINRPELNAGLVSSVKSMGYLDSAHGACDRTWNKGHLRQELGLRVVWRIDSGLQYTGTFAYQNLVPM